MFRMFFLLAFLLIGVTGCEQIDIDKCLDNGGRWNYENKTCEYK